MNYNKQTVNRQKLAPQPQKEEGETPKEEMIPINGFAQVLAMLKVADQEFRTSLLKRLSVRDPNLASSLKAELSKLV